MHSGGGWLAFFLLMVFAAMSATSFAYPADARVMPLIFGVVGAALCMLQLVLDIVGSRGRAAKGAFHPAPKLGRPQSHDEGSTGLGPRTLRREIVTWVYFLTFIAALVCFGFYVAVPALVMFYLWREAGTGLVAAAAAAMAAWAAMFLIIEGTFGFALFSGLVRFSTAQFPLGS